MSKLKVTTILGTRPELIRLSCSIKEFDRFFDHRLIHTGQNYDENLSTIFFQQLGIRTPDILINSSQKSLGNFLASALVAVEAELENHPPDAVVILGDTNSALTGIIAKRKAIPIYHLEAGNRSYDSNVPEEINRRVVDHFSDYNLPYTEHARRNLLAEGLHPRTISVIGSPLFEVIQQNMQEIEASQILVQLHLKPQEFFLVSAHRQENIDSPDRFITLIDSINALANKYNIPIVVSAHPRFRSRLRSINIELNELIRLNEPFGFFDYNKLQKHARIVFSDSGSISEESAILSFKAVTIRDSMERPEAVETGSILISGLTVAGILESAELAEELPLALSYPDDYFIPNSSQRVVNFIASTARLHNFWSGVRNVGKGGSPT